MLITQTSFILAGVPRPHRLLGKVGRHFGPIAAKKGDIPENSRTQQKPAFALRVSNPTLARSAIAVFSLGFLDAGYSGDWSRIGVISKGSEDLLKIAAFVVVPLCIFAIVSISKDPES